MNDTVIALTVHNGELIAGGLFTSAGGAPAAHIARWNGLNWQGLGGGVNNHVESLCTHAGRLIVGGAFTATPQQPGQCITTWTGLGWEALGGGVNGDVLALLSFNGDLIAGGYFTSAGGVPAGRIARWTDSGWRAMSNGMNHSVWDVAEFNGDLVAGGGFVTADGQTVNRVARWTPCLPPICPVGVSLTLWPPNHEYRAIDLNDVAGVMDPNGGEVTIVIDSITQDEPVNGTGDGDTTCDGMGIGNDVTMIRAERAGTGNGRVYHVNYTAQNTTGGTCNGTLLVEVPRSPNQSAIDDGPVYDSSDCFTVADVNGDHHVDGMDLLQILLEWGMTGPDRGTLNLPDADTNLDGRVDQIDLLMVISKCGYTNHQIK